VGTYRYIKEGIYMDTNGLIVSDLQGMKRAYFHKRNYDLSGTQFLAYVQDTDYAIESLLLIGRNATSNYEDDLENYKEFEFENSIGLFIFALVGIITSGISIFFIMRSSLSSRIYEVSVYRALGATKNDIRKLFVIEIFIISTISSLIGYLIMVFILIQSQNQVIEYVEVLYYSFTSFGLGIISLYIINIVFGILPVNILLFKTPANILSQYDI
jgi:ABC-type antimicrobial peptide transport system permease subunit